MDQRFPPRGVLVYFFEFGCADVPAEIKYL